MPLPSTIADLSTTAGSNSPGGGESPAQIDDYLRLYAAFIAQLREGSGFVTAVRSNVLGTAGVPAFSFVADTNTGMFSPAADILGFAVSGAERMRVTNTGSVVYGVADMVSTANFGAWDTTQVGGGYLSVLTSGVAIADIGTGARIVSGGGAADFGLNTRTGNLVFGTLNNERMRINASGNVGIGVNPSVRFHVDSGATDEVARFNATTNPYLSLHRANVRQFFVQSTGSQINLATELAIPLSFQTSGLERMRLDASGNLGLGTSGGLGRLDVDSGSNGVLVSFNSTNASGGYLRFSRSGTAVGDVGSGAQVVSGGGADNFGINARGSNRLILGVDSIERASLDFDGNLRLGAAGPGASAQKVIAIGNGTAPTTSPLNTGQLYVLAGALVYRGSSGTITTVAPA